MSDTLKLTPLNDAHVALGAKMVPFAGYSMPVQYPTGIKAEHAAVRETAGLFDVSHMGEFIVRGPEALGLIQRISVNDASIIEVGQAQYSAMCLETGCVIDDLIIYRFPDRFMLVVNASNLAKDWAWVSKHANDFEVEVTDVSDQTALLALQGPCAREILRPLASLNVDEVKYYRFAEGEVAGVPAVISGTGYTGEDGFEISVQNKNVENFIKLLSNKGAKPIGLGARDTLRLEAGLCLYGHELNQDISPVQANLKWAISKRRRKEGGFNGWEIIKNDLQNGVSKIRVGIKPSGRIIAREGTKIFSSSGEEIGIVTSGTFGPSVNAPVAMGYILSQFSEIDNKILLEVRGKKHDAVISKLPFYKKSYVK